MNVPLLEADSSDEDVERGPLPNYAQATTAAQAGQRVGFVGGYKPAMREGKDPVALCDVKMRMGLYLFVYFILKVKLVRMTGSCN